MKDLLKTQKRRIERFEADTAPVQTECSKCVFLLMSDLLMIVQLSEQKCHFSLSNISKASKGSISLRLPE